MINKNQVHRREQDRARLRLNILRVWRPGGVTMKERLTIGVLAAWLLGMIGSSPASSPDLEQGRTIYERHCMECHGAEGRGDGRHATSLSPRPGNLVSAQTSAKADEDLLKIIANGRPRTAMAAWNERLSREEQEAVLAYIRSLIRFTRSSTPSPPNP